MLKQISPTGTQELWWWDHHILKWNGRTLIKREIHMIKESDASRSGWATSCLMQRTGGPWIKKEQTMHTNFLELPETTLAIKILSKNKTRVSILLRIDNTTAVSYRNNLGGTVSHELIALAKELWMWCLERNIHISAQHLPGGTQCYSRCRIPIA